MEKQIRIRDEFIKLGQALKLAGIAQTIHDGAESFTTVIL